MTILTIYTIFERPSDFPEHFVVREFHVTPDGVQVAPHAWAIVADLDEARAAIPQGLTCMAREPGDEPQIVESWL